MQIVYICIQRFTKMEKEVFISLYLDTRRIKSNNLYPVKIRVFTTSPRVQKLYPTKFEFTQKEFESIWETTKPRKELKETRRALQAVETLFIETADLISPFSFEQFEKKLYRGKGEGENVFYQYGLIIQKLNGNNQLGTASNYDLSLKSLKLFILHLKGKETTDKKELETALESIKKLLFSDILKKYSNNNKIKHDKLTDLIYIGYYGVSTYFKHGQVWLGFYQYQNNDQMQICISFDVSKSSKQRNQIVNVLELNKWVCNNKEDENRECFKSAGITFFIEDNIFQIKKACDFVETGLELIKKYL